MRNRSAEKRERQDAVRRLRNRATKGAMRTACKKFEAAVVAGDKEKAATTLALALKLVDTAASKGAIHRNTANRTKSRLSGRYNRLVAPAAEQPKTEAAPAPAAN
ncbi:MAG: 30S ribosomal protein S20 [Sphaerochaeta sp.]|jgi:small subunit ribosomal protein S20|nr:30S ribosomal protein S20 [Sphaerochaeta sp.]MCH3920301.1 30S ribosomal protein S20 [Sphaerochaeta sp.]MCI2046044.1 30S ribosomal protein S20 [Sphaerochaeta sp.]MCI2097212.1 30S ribosomal protein S20 [Sphaerochaeta sp.]MCI2104525.1 30S ribosomal protein S20 [Sphaerochaeta sp.]